MKILKILEKWWRKKEDYTCFSHWYIHLHLNVFWLLDCTCYVPTILDNFLSRGRWKTFLIHINNVVAISKRNYKDVETAAKDLEESSVILVAGALARAQTEGIFNRILKRFSQLQKPFAGKLRSLVRVHLWPEQINWEGTALMSSIASDHGCKLKAASA